MKQTATYQLNQWDADDRILRTDFNRDNLIIENGFQALKAALEAERQVRDKETAALRAENLVVKLADVTAGAAAARIDVDVSRIDFTQYAEVRVLPQGRLAGSALYLRVNGSAEHYDLPGNSGNYAAPPFLGRWLVSSYSSGGGWVAPAGMVTLYPTDGTALVSAQSLSPLYLVDFIASAAVTWSGLRTLNFLMQNGEAIPAGTRILLYGVKK